MTDDPIKILLVEDNSGDARLIKEYLPEGQETTFEIEVVERLSDGLNVLGNRRFDLVLLDLNLPDSRGLDTLVKVSEKHPCVAIIVVTGKHGEEYGIKAVAAGAQEYLIKGSYD